MPDETIRYYRDNFYKKRKPLATEEYSKCNV